MRKESDSETSFEGIDDKTEDFNIRPVAAGAASAISRDERRARLPKETRRVHVHHRFLIDCASKIGDEESTPRIFRVRGAILGNNLIACLGEIHPSRSFENLQAHLRETRRPCASSEDTSPRKEVNRCDLRSPNADRHRRERQCRAYGENYSVTIGGRRKHLDLGLPASLRTGAPRRSESYLVLDSSVVDGEFLNLATPPREQRHEQHARSVLRVRSAVLGHNLLTRLIRKSSGQTSVRRARGAVRNVIELASRRREHRQCREVLRQRRTSRAATDLVLSRHQGQQLERDDAFPHDRRDHYLLRRTAGRTTALRWHSFHLGQRNSIRWVVRPSVTRHQNATRHELD
jgi:hypothetical protein